MVGEKLCRPIGLRGPETILRVLTLWWKTVCSVTLLVSFIAGSMHKFQAAHSALRF